MTLPGSKMIKIYKITCTKNDKSYIGLTSRTLKQRWQAHCSTARNGKGFRFHNAIRAHGEESFKMALLDQCDTIEEAYQLEKQYIKKYSSDKKGKGYNGNAGGSGGWIVVDKDEWLKKLSKSISGEGNPRYSGYTDEEILKLFKEKLESSENMWFKKAHMELIESHGMIKSFVKWRFKDYGGGRKGLMNALKAEGITEQQLKYSRSKNPEHTKNSIKALEAYHTRRLNGN